MNQQQNLNRVIICQQMQEFQINRTRWIVSHTGQFCIASLVRNTHSNTLATHQGWCFSPILTLCIHRQGMCNIQHIDWRMHTASLTHIQTKSLQLTFVLPTDYIPGLASVWNDFIGPRHGYGCAEKHMRRPCHLYVVRGKCMHISCCGHRYTGKIRWNLIESINFTKS